MLIISGDCIVLDKDFIDYKIKALRQNPNKDFINFTKQGIGYEGIN